MYTPQTSAEFLDEVKLGRERASASDPLLVTITQVSRFFAEKARLWTEHGTWEMTPGRRGWRRKFLGHIGTAEQQKEVCDAAGIDFWVLGKAGPHRYGEVPIDTHRYTKQLVGVW